MKNIFGLITVRSESSRLPRKCFLSLGNKSVIETVIDRCKNSEIMPIICTTISSADDPLEELSKNLNIPFGFKLNGFIKTNPKPNYTGAYNKSKTGNPNEFLGQRKDLTPSKMAELAKKFKDAGATIIGGCCEIRPAHIEAFSKLK